MISQHMINLLDTQEDKKNQGSGYVKGGLYDSQIEDVMKRYKDFKGVYPIDRINEIPVNKNTKKFGVIVNLDHHNQPGSHWVAIYVDKSKDKALEYYDSFGDQP